MPAPESFREAFTAALRLAPPVLRQVGGRWCRAYYDGDSGPKGMRETYSPRFVLVSEDTLVEEAWARLPERHAALEPR